MDFEFLLLLPSKKIELKITGNRPLFICRAPFNDSHWRFTVPAMLHQFFTDETAYYLFPYKRRWYRCLEPTPANSGYPPLVITAMACHNGIT